MDRWPAAMCFRTAAKYLEYSDPKVIETLVNSGRLVAFSVVPRGERRVWKEDLDLLLRDLSETAKKGLKVA